MWVLGLVGCFHVVEPRVSAEGELRPGEFPHEIFARVLAARVDAAGFVDYAGLQRDRADLDLYTAWLARASPASDPTLFPDREDALAYWINAYNALAMTAVIDRPGLGSVLDDKIGFFYATRYVVGGRHLDLYRMENGIVRPDFADPRVHFALNCQSVGCPRFPAVPFPADGLDAALEEAARGFCTDPAKVRVEGDTLHVSQIFEWYAEDFAAAGGVVAFVSRYRDDVPADAKLAYIPYDWTLLAQEGKRP